MRNKNFSESYSLKNGVESAIRSNKRKVRILPLMWDVPEWSMLIFSVFTTRQTNVNHDDIPYFKFLTVYIFTLFFFK